MAFRQAWMVEVVTRIVCHADLLHHAAGTQVCWNGERNYTVEFQVLKAVAEYGACAFSRQSSAPAVKFEAPTDFYRGHEWRIERGNGKADEAGEGMIFKQLDGEGSETVKIEVGLSAVGERVGLRG